MSMLDYFTNNHLWLQANLQVVRRFERIMFLPGFWSEYGMCTEPSAFGSRCIWYENSFPSAEKVLHDYSEINRLQKPDCRHDGLLPFVMQRLRCCQVEIEVSGHYIRFATARGPLNIASYLLGHTEFLIGLKTNPTEIHRLLTIITDFLVDWIELQAATFDSIDGIFLLDDLIGFLGNEDFQEFALPYLTRVYGSRNVSVCMLHNDAPGLITAPHLAAMGVNVFNFSFQHAMDEMQTAAGPSVVLLGNIPPRDVLAQGSPEDVHHAVIESLALLDDKRRVLVSCGGGAPPGVSSENLDALCQAAMLVDVGSGNRTTTARI